MKIPVRPTTALVLSLALSGCGSDGGAGGFGSGTLEEAPEIAASSDPDWWVSSGALFFRNDVARTNHGDLPAESPWRQRYARSNPTDTDGGAHPQNVFRLVRRRVLGDVAQEVGFRVDATSRSASPNRNASNGVFLFQRYLSENDDYASGVRVDGQATIKKKTGGTTRTLALRDLYAHGAAWDRDVNFTFLPQGRTIAMRTETRNQPDGSVDLRLFVDGDLVLEVIDGTGGLTSPGLTGIRSDFMDVEFEGYEVTPLS
jgi:hypothetical protein